MALSTPAHDAGFQAHVRRARAQGIQRLAVFTLCAFVVGFAALATASWLMSVLF